MSLDALAANEASRPPPRPRRRRRSPLARRRRHDRSRLRPTEGSSRSAARGRANRMVGWRRTPSDPDPDPSREDASARDAGLSRGSNACAAASASSRAARSARHLIPGRPTPRPLVDEIFFGVDGPRRGGIPAARRRTRASVRSYPGCPPCLYAGENPHASHAAIFARVHARAMRRDLPEILGRSVSSGSGSATALLGSAWSREKRRAFSADVSVRDGFFVTSGERSSCVRRQNDPKLRKPPRDDDSVADDASRVGF